MAEAGQRVKGVDTELLVIAGRDPQLINDAIKSLEISIDMEIKEEMYLGEKSNRTDEVYNGVSGKIEFHSASGDTFTLIKAITDRAKRRVAGIKFNLKTTLNYPNGDTPRIIVPDLHWGAIPMSFSNKNDYVGFSLTWKADDFRILEG